MATRCLLVFVGLLGLALVAPAAAVTWHIYEDRTGTAPTIQDAMAQAVSGDLVLVYPGTYMDPIDIPSGVALASEAGAEQTILDADHGPRVIGVGLNEPIFQQVKVQGFTLTGANLAPYVELARTIDVDGALEVRDCIITGNFTDVGGAHLRDGDLRIYDTLFTGNQGGFTSPGIDGVSCANGYMIVERCTFENHLWGDILNVKGGIVEFRDNVVRDVDANKGIVIAAEAADVLIYNNLFDGVPYPITVSGGPSVTIRQNTFARAGSGFSALGPALGTNATVDRNVMTGAFYGLWICCPLTTVTCNDSWGNVGENWYGRGDLTGIDGNFSQPPLYCNPPGDDFRVSDGSPLLSTNNGCGEQIGAFGMGCTATTVEPASWGRIKASYLE